MIGFIIGGILVAISIGLTVSYKNKGNRLYLLRATETSTVSGLELEAKDVSDGLGEKGSFSKYAEVKGRVACDSPLTSELANARCVYYSMSVTRKWEEQYWETDSNGRQTQKTRQGSDTVSSNVRHVPFFVQDATGRIKIEPDGAEMIPERAYTNFQPGDISGGSISIGNFRLNIPGINLGSGRRTIGYQYEESVIPLDKEVYVIGEAVDTGGTLRLKKPSEKGKNFIISLKSEEELQRSIKGSMTGRLVGGIVCIVLGAAAIILQILGIIPG